MADFQIGDVVPLVYTISATATVTLTVTDPDGTTSNPSLTQGGSPPAVTYTANVAVSKAGTWLFRFVATGAVTDAEDGHFYVRAISTANVYTTVPELKSYLGISASDTVDDSELESAIQVASRSEDSDCQRHFYQITEARTFEPCDLWLLKLPAFNDLVSVTTLKTDAGGDGTYETTWTSSDYQLLTSNGSPNVNAGPEPRPYTQIRAVATKTFPWLPQGTTAQHDLIEIDGVWGWPAVPAAVRQACLILATQIFKQKDAPFGAAGIGELGIVRVRDNAQAARLLEPYRRYAVLMA